MCILLLLLLSLFGNGAMAYGLFQLCYPCLSHVDYSGSRRSLGDFSIQDCTFASKGYYVALCRPHSDIPVVLGELGILGTLQKHGLVLDSTCNPDCEFMVG